MDKFEDFDSVRLEQRPAACVVCETMLPEAVDGTLDAADRRVFDAHVAGCTACSHELAEAKRGAAWLGMLKSQAPEPPAHLLAKILAETSGVASPRLRDETAPAWGTRTSFATPPMRDEATHGWGTQTVRPATQRAGWGARWTAFRRSLSESFSIQHAHSAFQPRMAMTAAMAFFSIALTLNLMGVRLRDLRAEDFSASGIRRTMADTSASLTRTFQNNRSVDQVESRLRELDDESPRQGGSER
jgi:hypothetical protein